MVERHAVGPHHERALAPNSWNRLESEMRDLMGRFFAPIETGLGFGERFSPSVNLVETDDSLEVSVELPGIKPDDVDVEIKNNALWISGVKKSESEEKGKAYHRIERHHGEFQRVIPLPTEIDEEKVDATYRDGVLRIEIGKSDQVKPRRIHVKT
ncbi:18 kDa heat shock protein [Planctomycetes bacterium Pan216]|uniref:18 kDa heat shock protein n=1 Tax=Kolteria novifilia TaxID=2527975 RepID=A0A518B615_9BACT|nr:18 kDa heat shock protein [Planctomycetes bacterium Pan216]